MLYLSPFGRNFSDRKDFIRIFRFGVKKWIFAVFLGKYIFEGNSWESGRQAGQKLVEEKLYFTDSGELAKALWMKWLRFCCFWLWFWFGLHILICFRFDFRFLVLFLCLCFGLFTFYFGSTCCCFFSLFLFLLFFFYLFLICFFFFCFVCVVLVWFVFGWLS